MTETQAQTSTYGEVTQAGIALVRVLGDLGKTWILSRNEQRRAANQQPAPTTPNADAVIRTAAGSQAESATIEAAKLPSTLPAPARVSKDATSDERARALTEQARAEENTRVLAERARAEERVRALAEQSRAVEARILARLAEMKVLLEQFLAAQRAPAPSPNEAQAARAEAATIPSPHSTQLPLPVNAGHAVVTPSTVADGIPISAPSVTVPHSPPIDTSPAVETPVMQAAESPAKAETASPDVTTSGQPSDGASQEATSAEAARTATTEKPETAPNPPQTTPEPELTPAQRRAKWIVECKEPHVQSWRMIKRFIRRMTEFDLIAFTSSVPMFRAFLAMLRAMTPYYEGPKFSLDELAPDGMPLSSATMDQTA